MRSITTLIILAALLACVAAWSKEDQEIFRLRDEVALSEGPEVNFYDFLEIKNNANQEDINKAYRKKSKQLHPDKVKRQFVADRSTGKDNKKKSGSKPAVHVSKGPSQSEIDAAGKAASDRFARLGLVTNILRGEGRARYDHFLSNGFPKWKGTGYYYARFRPGVGTVLLGLFIFVGGAGHWLVLYLNWKRHTEFVGRYINHARNAAGSMYIPGIDSPAAPATPTTEEQDPMTAQPRNRRERRMQEKSLNKDKKGPKVTQSVKSSPAPTPPAGGRRKRVIAQNGKPLVVDEEGNVYLEQYDEDGVLHEYLLDVDEMPKPTIKDTTLVRLPIWVYHKTAGRLFPQKQVEGEYYEEEEVEVEEVDAAEGFEVLEKAKTSAINGNGKTARRSKKSGRGR